MPEVDVWRALVTEVDSGRPGALLAVVDSRGSSPGRRGAVMAVGQGAVLVGTIGGGAAEAGLVSSVVGQLQNNSLHPRRFVLEHREGTADASGMICGGSQVVVVSPIGQRHRTQLAEVVDVLARGRQIDWSVDPSGWRIAGTDPGAGAADWQEQVRSGPTHTAHVIGAGHVGRALSRILVELDFRVVLFDERPGLLDTCADLAHELIAVPYEQLAAAIAEGPSNYAAIMAHAHDRDAAALTALQGLDLGYLGLLGSRAKVHRIVGEYPMPPWFHAPMGIPIGSSTPAEIAVSVAAEMVAARSRAVRSGPR